EQPCVRRQALHVAPLALGIQRVENQARFAGSRDPGDDDQPLVRQIERDVLEIVSACAADADRGLHAVLRKMARLESFAARQRGSASGRAFLRRSPGYSAATLA